ncbi:MAG: hypothetical protein ABFD80_07795 [Acidobacteriota bacterium]
MIKKILIGVGALILVAVIGLFFFLGSIVKAGIQTVGPKMTKTSVKVSLVTVSPLTGRGRIRGLVIGNPPGFKSESALRLKDFRIRVVPRSLTKSVIVVRSISIEGPEITKEGNNLETIQRNVQSFLPEDTGEKKSATKIVVDDLWIKKAKVRYEVLGKMMSITIPDIHLTGIGRDSGGATPAQVVDKVLGSILSGVTAGVKNLGKSVTDQAEKVGSGLKDLFKKK